MDHKGELIADGGFSQGLIKYLPIDLPLGKIVRSLQQQQRQLSRHEQGALSRDTEEICALCGEWFTKGYRGYQPFVCAGCGEKLIGLRRKRKK